MICLRQEVKLPYGAMGSRCLRKKSHKRKNDESEATLSSKHANKDEQIDQFKNSKRNMTITVFLSCDYGLG